jgi:Kef-type K+ transport system membrane component KefB
MGLGWMAGHFVIPEAGWQVHAFIGATLCATSVGITARVLKDLGCAQRTESKIILGAAVIDDVLGLIVLAIVSGVILEGEVRLVSLLQIVGLAFGFLAVALLLGALQLPRAMFHAASFLRGHGLLVVTALVICFGFAFAANLVGLAPIIGAFAAGLILEGAHYQEVGDQRWQSRNLEEALAPLSALLVPIFFVEMGIQVDLASFQDPSVWTLAATITVMAVIGKQVCSLGVREKGLNRAAVGLGMIPRGEVGLIFANEGRKLVANGEPVINAGTYSAVVVMVMFTTVITPPLLKWSLAKKSPQSDEDSQQEETPP